MLPLSNRLKKKKDFDFVFKKGSGFKSPSLIVKIAENKTDSSRFGIVASLKVSKKAVERNKIRRRLSEAIKGELQEIKIGLDFIFVCLPKIKDKNFSEIQGEVKDILKKAKVYRTR